MKNYSLIRHAKLKFFAALFFLCGWIAASGIFTLWMLFGIHNSHNETMRIGIALGILMMISGIAVLVFGIRKNYKITFSKIEIDEEKLTVFVPKSERYIFRWEDIVESGIFAYHVQERQGARLFHTRRFICLSKMKMAVPEKHSMKIMIDKNTICFEYQEELLFEMKKYYAISTNENAFQVWE